MIKKNTYETIPVWMKALCALLLAVLVLCSFSPNAWSQTVSEEKLKSALVLTLLKYLTWPKNTFESDTDPFIIHVFGDESIIDELSTIAGTAAVRGRRIKIVHIDGKVNVRPEECHLAYFDSSSNANINDFMFAYNAKKGVMIVSDTKNFTRDGGMVRLYRQGAKFAIEINRDAVKPSRIKVSSQLLKFATRYENKNSE